MAGAPLARVIITHSRSLMALVAAHSLAKKNIEIIGADTVDLTFLSFSKYVRANFTYQAYQKNEEAFILDLEKNIIQYKPKNDIPYLLIPSHTETPLISKYKSRLEKHIIVACPDYESLNQLHPKDQFSNTVSKLGIKYPQTLLSNNLSVDSDLKFPILVKPIDASGGRGIREVGNSSDLSKAVKDIEEEFNQNSIIQELIKGDDYCLTVVCKEGEILASAAYTNIQRFPCKTGAGIVREAINPEIFLDSATKLMKAVNLTGIAEIDYLWDKKAEPYILEVNPRFGGGIFQCVESGIDFPAILYKIFTNQKIEADVIGQFQIGTKTKTPILWLFAALDEMLCDEEDFQVIENAWLKAAAELKSGDIYHAIIDFKNEIIENFDFRDNIKKFQKTFSKAFEAKNELLNKDDPLVIFGLLFIISSLIKHKKLPAEVLR